VVAPGKIVSNWLMLAPGSHELGPLEKVGRPRGKAAHPLVNSTDGIGSTRTSAAAKGIFRAKHCRSIGSEFSLESERTVEPYWWRRLPPNTKHCKTCSSPISPEECEKRYRRFCSKECSQNSCRRSACDDLKRSTDVRTVLGDALVNAAMKCTAEDALFAIKRSKRLNSLIRKMGSLVEGDSMFPSEPLEHVDCRV